MRVISSLAIIIVGVIFSIAGDVFLKQSNFSNHKYLLVGMFLYALAGIPVALVFKKLEFGTVFLVWQAVNLVGVMTIAYFIYHEAFTFNKTMALVFTLVALYFSYK